MSNGIPFKFRPEKKPEKADFAIMMLGGTILMGEYPACAVNRELKSDELVTIPLEIQVALHTIFDCHKVPDSTREKMDGAHYRFFSSGDTVREIELIDSSDMRINKLQNVVKDVRKMLSVESIQRIVILFGSDQSALLTQALILGISPEELGEKTVVVCCAKDHLHDLSYDAQISASNAIEAAHYERLKGGIYLVSGNQIFAGAGNEKALANQYPLFRSRFGSYGELIDSKYEHTQSFGSDLSDVLFTDEIRDRYAKPLGDKEDLSLVPVSSIATSALTTLPKDLDRFLLPRQVAVDFEKRMDLFLGEEGLQKTMSPAAHEEMLAAIEQHDPLFLNTANPIRTQCMTLLGEGLTIEGPGPGNLPSKESVRKSVISKAQELQIPVAVIGKAMTLDGPSSNTYIGDSSNYGNVIGTPCVLEEAQLLLSAAISRSKIRGEKPEQIIQTAKIAFEKYLAALEA